MHLEFVLSKDTLVKLAKDLKLALENLLLPEYGAEIMQRCSVKSVEKSNFSGGRVRTSSVKYVEYSTTDDVGDACRNFALSGSLTQQASTSSSASSTAGMMIAWNKIRRPVIDPLITACERVSPVAAQMARRLIESPEDVACANLFYSELIRCIGIGPGIPPIESNLPLGRLVIKGAKSAIAQLLAGHELAFQRKHSLALEKYVAAFSLDPDQPLTCLNLGVTLYSSFFFHSIPCLF